jgi:hypothetical protein
MPWFTKAKPVQEPRELTNMEKLFNEVLLAKVSGGIGRSGINKILNIIDAFDELEVVSSFDRILGMISKIGKVILVQKVLSKSRDVGFDIKKTTIQRIIENPETSDEIKPILQKYLDNEEIMSPRMEAEFQKLANDQDPTDDLEDFLKEMVKDMGEGAQPDLLAPGDKYPELYKALTCLDPKKASNLPPGWVAKVSSKSGKTYYEKNGKSQWNKPTAGGKRRTMNRRKHAKKTRRTRR